MNIIKFSSFQIQVLKFDLIQIQGLCFFVIASGKCVDVLTTGIYLVLEYFQNFSFNVWNSI